MNIFVLHSVISDSLNLWHICYLHLFIFLLIVVAFSVERNWRKRECRFGSATGAPGFANSWTVNNWTPLTPWAYNPSRPNTTAAVLRTIRAMGRRVLPPPQQPLPAILSITTTGKMHIMQRSSNGRERLRKIMGEFRRLIYHICWNFLQLDEKERRRELRWLDLQKCCWFNNIVNILINFSFVHNFFYVESFIKYVLFSHKIFECYF